MNSKASVLGKVLLRLFCLTTKYVTRRPSCFPHLEILSIINQYIIMPDDAYQAALRGGLSAAMPKKETAPKSSKAPKEVTESDGVKAAKAILKKLDDSGGDKDQAPVPDAVNDAMKKGLAAAAGLDKVTKEDRAKAKAEKDKVVAQQAKTWLDGKTEEERKELIQKAMAGGLASVAATPKTKPKKKEKDDDEEPLPSSVELWLVKMKADTKDDEDLSAAVKAALAGGATAAAAADGSPTNRSGSFFKKKVKTVAAAPVDPIPPAVRQWIEANRNAPKWEELAGDTMTAAMYGGGIASMTAKKKVPAPKGKQSEEELVPKSIQRWLEQNAGGDDHGTEYMSLRSSQYVPTEVKAFLDEAAKDHGTEEAAAALNRMVVNEE